MAKQLSLILALCLLPFLAQAHYLWIESADAEGAHIYFGEFNEGVREKAGGRLDERDAIEGWLLTSDNGRQPLTFSKKPDHFSVKAAKAGWVVVQDLASEVKDWTASDIGVVKPMFYARGMVGERLTAAQPAMTLDIIPDPKEPHRLRVFFHNDPLAKAKVMVHAPNEWSKELETDADGGVTIATPWPGRYVVEVIHRERKPGEFQGKSFEAIRHRATFSHLY